MTAETFECYIVLQTIMLLLSFFSALCQIVDIKFPGLHEIFRVTIISFAIVHSAFNLIIFGLSDHYSILHVTVLILLILTGVLQCLVLGFILTEKHKIKYIFHDVA